MIFNDNKTKGRAGLSLAIAYFGCNGYTVSLPLNDTQDYDLIVDDGKKLYKVQVKATGQKKENGNYICSLRTISGTSRVPINTVKESSADLLFCVTEEQTMYLFPVKDIVGNTIITLSKKPKSKFASKDSLDTYKYIVTI